MGAKIIKNILLCLVVIILISLPFSIADDSNNIYNKIIDNEDIINGSFGKITEINNNSEIKSKEEKIDFMAKDYFFNYYITATGTENISIYPNQNFNWVVTGTGTETWYSYPDESSQWKVRAEAIETWYTTEIDYNEQSESVTGGTQDWQDWTTFSAPMSGIVYYSISIWCPHPGTSEITIRLNDYPVVGYDENDGRSNTWTGSFTVSVGDSVRAHLTSTYGTSSVTFRVPVNTRQVTHRETRTVTSGPHSGTVNYFEGTKYMDSYYLQPQPQQGGTMSPPIYSSYDVTHPAHGSVWINQNSGIVYAQTSYRAENTATRTATDSGSGIVNAQEAVKLITAFSAQPYPQQGGTMGAVTYSVSDDNANVNSWLSANYVYASTGYSETETEPWSDTKTGQATINKEEGDKLITTSLLVAPNGDTMWSAIDDNERVETWMVDNKLYARLLNETYNISLKQGWNLIGYPSIEENNATDVFEAINDQLELVFMYDAFDIGNEWKSYSPNRPVFLNTLTVMQPGYGYWVKVDQDTSLVLE